MPYKKYTLEENNNLQLFYPTSSKQFILSKIPNRTWVALQQQAKKLGIRRIADERKDKKTTNLKRLLDGTMESFYWLGFLLADGNFRGKRSVRCELSTKDYQHLEKLAKYLNTTVKYPNKRNSILFEIYDIDVVPKIIELLGLKHNKIKTYSCPKIETLLKLNQSELFALFIGFIDGDGYIKRNNQSCTYLIISNHVSWKPFYDLMIQQFKKYSLYDLPKYTITKKGYIRWTCGQRNFLVELKCVVKQMKLPILKRKWSEIPTNKIENFVDKVVKEAEEIVEKNGGILPSVRSLKNNGKRYIYRAISNHPEAFKHIKRRTSNTK